MRLVSTNSIYDVADGVRKRIIQPVEGNVYSQLYRLTGATKTYTDPNSKTASYTLAMGYDNMHRITLKSQYLTQGSLQFDGTLNVGYDLTYTYGQEDGKKFQLDNVSDVNYRTEATPDENQKTRNSHAYEYDANGNLVYVNTGEVSIAYRTN